MITTAKDKKKLLTAFICLGTLKDIVDSLTSSNHLVQRKKQHQRKVLLISFHLIDAHILGFHAQTQKL